MVVIKRKDKTMTTKLIPQEVIQNKILLIRGLKVMLDSDLAELYDVSTYDLKRAVRRNLSRFPADFMFELTPQEYSVLRRHFGALKRGAHSKYLPYAFTEHGILMLSNVLNSERAIQVNIQIMRAFTKLREMLANHKELREKIEAMEKKYDHQFQIVFKAIKELLAPQAPPPKSKTPIGFLV
jgi:phage regulator Rha-like protein